MKHSQIASVLRDRAMLDEIRERVESASGLPKAQEWNIKPDTIKSVVAGKAPNAEHFASRPYTEAIVLLYGRPALLVRNDSFEVPRADEWRARLSPYQSRLEHALKSVGRVELFDHPTFDWVGTAWMIADHVLVTNRHVALTFARKKGKGFEFIRNPEEKPVRAQVDFREEYRGRDSREFAVDKVLFIEELSEQAPDLALLQLAKNGALPAPIPLHDGGPQAERYVAVIGYPARDSRNDSQAMVKVFGDIYNVKRLAPGMVATSPKKGWTFTHDCSTLGGNSGSAVIDVETGHAVGLHFGGRFQQANYAVKAKTLLDAVTKLKLQVAVPAAPVEEKPPFLDTDWEDRRGYEEDFLGPSAAHHVPLPKTNGDVAPIKPASAKGVLRYTHFSVVISKRRKLALFTAVNIDGSQLRQIPRKGDRWYLDPRLPAKAQTGNELYASNDLDRGHMVRRLDPVWGSQDEATQANEDTFHFTNACPQHKDLNQRTWNDLENYILDNAGARDLKVSVFTGPVLQDDDPEYRDVQLPREFWKVAVLVNDQTGKLSATAYLLSQADMLPDLEFVYGRFRTYQIPVKRVEALTGLAFGKLSGVDPLGKEPIDETLGMGTSSRLIEGPRDIVFG